SSRPPIVASGASASSSDGIAAECSDLGSDARHEMHTAASRHVATNRMITTNPGCLTPCTQRYTNDWLLYGVGCLVVQGPHDDLLCTIFSCRGRDDPSGIRGQELGRARSTQLDSCISILDERPGCTILPRNREMPDPELVRTAGDESVICRQLVRIRQRLQIAGHERLLFVGHAIVNRTLPRATNLRRQQCPGQAQRDGL